MPKRDPSKRDYEKKQLCKVCHKPLPRPMTDHGSPFCSERCRLQDLSKWFGESYKIASTGVPKDGDDDQQ